MQYINRMHYFLFALAALMAAALVPTSAIAARITIIGTVSKATLKKDCAATGGTFHSGNSDTCTKGQNIVTCTKGFCEGVCVKCPANRTKRGIKEFLGVRSGVKTLGGARSPKHGVRPVKVGGVKTRHLGHGRVKTGGFKTKAIYRHTGGPTDQGGKGFNSHRNTGPTFSTAEHHGGRHR